MYLDYEDALGLGADDDDDDDGIGAPRRGRRAGIARAMRARAIMQRHAMQQQFGMQQQHAMQAQAMQQNAIMMQQHMAPAALPVEPNVEDTVIGWDAGVIGAGTAFSQVTAPAVTVQLTRLVIPSTYAGNVAILDIRVGMKVYNSTGVLFAAASFSEQSRIILPLDLGVIFAGTQITISGTNLSASPQRLVFSLHGKDLSRRCNYNGAAAIPGVNPQVYPAGPPGIGNFGYGGSMMPHYAGAGLAPRLAYHGGLPAYTPRALY